MTLAAVADEIQHRIIHIFARDHEVRLFASLALSLS